MLRNIFFFFKARYLNMQIFKYANASHWEDSVGCVVLLYSMRHCMHCSMLKTSSSHSKFCIEVTYIEDKSQDLLQTLGNARNEFWFYTKKVFSIDQRPHSLHLNVLIRTSIHPETLHLGEKKKKKKCPGQNGEGIIIKVSQLTHCSELV